MKLPFNKEITERVEPQDGQGKPIKCFIGQTIAVLFSIIFEDRLKYIQIYPVKHAINKIKYSLFNWVAINIETAEFFAYSSPWLHFES